MRLSLVGFMVAGHSKNSLGEAHTEEQNGHGPARPTELTSVRSSHFGTLIPMAGMWQGPEREEPLFH